MTCRSLLWIAAAAVTVGAVASTPSIAGADPDVGWNVTIDGPATSEVATKQLRITGTAAREGLIDVLPPEKVSVRVVPQGLPAGCTEATGTADVVEERYELEVGVLCNGRYEIQVVAHAGVFSSGGAATRDLGVAEPAPRPEPPRLEVTGEGGLHASWDPSNELDADGTILMVNFREIRLAPGVVEATLPPSDRRAAVAVRALRWGAGGPGTTVSSPESGSQVIGEVNPHTPTNPQPPSTLPPSTLPPSTLPPPSPPGPSGTVPSGTTGGGIPTRGTGASSTTLPAGYSEELPFGAPDDAFVPGAEPNRRPSSEAEERAVSSAAPPGGLVRTTEKRSPGLVVPFALGLLMITMAVHIAWYLRRSRPSGGGQVRPT